MDDCDRQRMWQTYCLDEEGPLGGGIAPRRNIFPLRHNTVRNARVLDHWSVLRMLIGNVFRHVYCFVTG